MYARNLRNMKYHRKQVLDHFSNKLLENFKHYCRTYKEPPELDQFITYLIDRDFITKSTISEYTITETFEELYYSNDMQKTKTVEVLASKLNLTPRSIWNVLKKNSIENPDTEKKQTPKRSNNYDN